MSPTDPDPPTPRVVSPPPGDPLAAAAVEYASMGLRVVPLHPREKKPRPRDWVQVASDDLETVAGWWRDVPEGNVGVALGGGSGVVGVDVDTEEGSEILLGMAGAEGLPATWWMTTGKGTRLLFAIPDTLEVEPRTHVIKGADGGEALRFQGRGGQCVMPPSVHPGDPAKGVPPGRLYAWVEGRSPADVPVAPMPGWLLAEMCRPEKPRFADPQTHGPAGCYPPGAAFNQTGGWDDLLGRHGWTCHGRRPGGVEYWTRPGKDPRDGISATLGHCHAGDGTRALYVFSGSVENLAPDRAYDLFGCYARLDHGGDFAAAAKQLAVEGHGERRDPYSPEERFRRLEYAMAAAELRIRQLERTAGVRHG